MYQPARERPDQDRRWGRVEILCVALVLVAVLAVVVWIVTHAGGGVLNQG